MRVAEVASSMLVHELLRMNEQSLKEHEKAECREGDVFSMAWHTRIESLGYEIGFRLVERVAQQRLLKVEPLEVIKFLCRDIWMEIFGKHIDKLQTNHRGIFVLKDNAFRWAASDSREEILIGLSKLSSGLIRGALANLGLVSFVSADFDSGSMSFQIRMTEK